MILISTVTTVSTITSTTTATSTTTSSVATVAGAPLAAQMGLIAVISLIILLIVKELVRSYSIDMDVGVCAATQLSRLDRAVNVGIIPLLYAFGVIVVFKVAQVLNL